MRKLRYLLSSRRNRRVSDDAAVEVKAEHKAEMNNKLSENLKSLKAALGDAQDLKVHLFRFGPDNGLSGALIFIDGLVSESTLTDAILRPLKNCPMEDGRLSPETDLLDVLAQEVLCASCAKNAASVSELATGCLSGDTILLVDGCPDGLVINSKGWEKRTVSEPQSESVVRGPREGFTENLRTNTSLIRRKIRNGQLKVEQMTVGRKTQTCVCLMYLDGVADLKVVETVKYRIGGLDVESILETGYIEEYIEDAPFSPFATIGYSEKPDVVAAKILEGRVAIAVDGTPFVLTAPMLLAESFQTAEDYYNRSLYASLIRILRFVAFLITVFAPAVYIALVSFQHELIPTTLLFTLAKAREGTPFPAFIEAVIMVFAFEILREAGVRLPRPVGQAISIVGALIMGDAAVNAGTLRQDGGVRVSLTINSVANISELHGFEEMKPPELLKHLEKLAQEEIKNKITGCVSTAQALDADIFGFGTMLYKQYPKQWNGMKDRWSELFSDIDLSIQVKVRIPETGQIVQSLEMEEKMK